MPRSGTQTRQRILEVAVELFGEKGFDKVTVKQIANLLHISEPAVYRYFPSKDDLTSSALDYLAQRLEYEPIFAHLLAEDDVTKLLGELAQHIVDFFTQKQEVYRLLLYSALAGHSQVRQTYTSIRGRYTSFLKGQLDRLFKLGHIRKVNNEITARCFIGMVFDCALANTLWRGMQGKLYTPSLVVANNVDIYAKGLKKSRE